MRRIRSNLLTVAILLSIGVIASTGRAEEATRKSGTFSGTIKFEGEIPFLPPLVKQGDSKVKDAAVCAASAIPDESLVVDRKRRGIANVFVYLRMRPENLSEDDAKPEKKSVVLERKGCRYVPHTTIVRTNQKVKVVSRDKIAHNTHFYVFKNTAYGMLVPREGEVLLREFDRPEPLPMKVGCDIHPWMEAWVLVVDHPFAAVTGKDGKFKIEGLPLGTHEFRIWHEESGWLEKSCKVSINAGKVTKAKLKYPADRFLKEDKPAESTD